MVDLLGDWLGTGEGAVLLAILGFATLGTLALFVVAVVGARRRRSTPYFLLAGAIGLLVVRSVVGIGTVLGWVPMPAHHIVEHTADFLIALLVLVAIYRGRDATVA